MNEILETEQMNPGLSIPSETDEHLMEVIQAHGPMGLTELRRRYTPLLKALSMSILHNDADAEDLLQEVYLEVWNVAVGYNPLKGRPLSWIATLTRRRSIDRLRRREAYGRLEERFADEVNRQVEGWTHVHEDVAQSERKAHLNRAMRTLPVAQRSAILLAYQKQMTQREIANHTGLPLGTIKTRLELGLKKLASCLRGFEDLLWIDRSSPRGSKKPLIVTAGLATGNDTTKTKQDTRASMLSAKSG